MHTAGPRGARASRTSGTPWITRVALLALLLTGCGKSPTEPTDDGGDGGGGGNGGGGGGGGGQLDQAGAWMWATPTPQGSPLRRVRYATENVVYAISLGGAVMKSIDAGASWEIAHRAFDAQSRANGSLYGLFFLDAARGWVVGTAGQIASTTNGGATWSDQSIQTSASVRDIHFVDAMKGFAVGDRGLLQRTDDGGTSWTPVSNNAGNTDLTAVVFVSPAIGWVGGEDGYVLYTEDGGDTWDPLATSWTDDVTLGTAVAPDQVAFATGDGRVVMSTSPGSWTFLMNRDSVSDLQLTDAQNGTVLYGEGNEAYLGRLVGGVWSYDLLASPQPLLTFARNGNDVVVGGWWGMMQYSSNGGTTWQPVSETLDTTDPYDTQLLDVAFADESVGLSVGTAGTVLRTTDGGVTWSVPSSGVAADLRGVSITSGGTAVAVGEDATVIRSGDGGVTWEEIALPISSQTLHAVSMWDDDRGLIVGTGFNGVETIYGTDDAGLTWMVRERAIPDDESPSAFFDVWTEGSSHAWVGGVAGLVIHTDDGGETWTSQSTGSPWITQSVQFVDEIHGWAATGEQDLAYTVNGGDTWVRVTGLPSDVDDLHFGSPDVGVAVGTTGHVYGSRDGGETWTEQYAGLTTYSHMRAVWMSSPTDAVMVGTQTYVLYTRSAGENPAGGLPRTRAR